MISLNKLSFPVIVGLLTVIVLPWWQHKGLNLETKETGNSDRKLLINDVKPLSLNPSYFLKKPIFSQSRRQATNHLTMKGTSAKSNLVREYKYRGTMIDGLRTAIILENNGKLIHAEIGQKISGWQLVKIELGKIILSNGFETINLLEENQNNTKNLQNKKRDTRWLPASQGKE
ncbi:MAG: hypothetical protein VX987_01655 [Pseudomonadota bacterium]|nr:hypothetical protein [Pseudomonadota bacterium]